MTLRIQLLGPPRVEVSGRPIVVDTRKAVALLAYVAVVDRPVARESLAELLWPESDPEDGRGALRRTLSVLRSALGGRWLTVDRRQVALGTDDVQRDVTDFRTGIAEATHRHTEALACAACRRRLAAAVAVYRDDFLAGFSLRDSAAWDEWQALEAEALRGELAGALRRLVALESAEGRHDQALAAGHRLLALDPLDETAHRALMRLSAAAGDRAAVVRQYRACVQTLSTELGVAPDAETTELYRQLIEAEPRAPEASASGVGDAALRILEAAAILGDAVDPDLAAAVAQVDEHAGASAWDELVRAGVLLERDGDHRYAWAAPTVRAATLERVGLARRRQLHRAAATALGPAGDPSRAAELAMHLAAAGDTLRAAEVHRQAAEQARRQSAHDTAAGHLSAALALGHPDRLGVLEALGDAETLLGRYGEALAAYEAAAALAGPEDVARYDHRLGALHLRRGALELADLHLTAALARLPEGPSPLRARILADRSLTALRRGVASLAERLARASLREARAGRDADTESQAENVLALLARRRGDVASARRHLRRSLARSGVADDRGARVAALNHLALLERAVGNLDDALALTEEALRRCTALGDRHREAALRNNRADLLHALGRPREAAEEQVRSVTAFAAVGDRGGLEPEIWKLVDW